MSLWILAQIKKKKRKAFSLQSIKHVNPISLPIHHQKLKLLRSEPLIVLYFNTFLLCMSLDNPCSGPILVLYFNTFPSCVSLDKHNAQYATI